MAFHTDHKLLILSHSPKHYSLLGRLVAGMEKHRVEEQHQEYFEKLMEGLRLMATVSKNANVLQHMMGYFKKQLTADQKLELSEVIKNFHSGLIPLVVPITLMNHYVRIYNEPYLKRQYYLNPHPLELELRNNV